MTTSSGTTQRRPADEIRRRLLERRLHGRPVAKDAPAIPPLVRRDVPLPLSFAQERLWFLDRLAPGSPEYLIPVALRLRGTLDEDALERALSQLVARHEILRTRYESRDGKPVQLVDEPALVPLRRVALTGAAAPEPELETLVAEESRRGFDLERGPVLRATLVELADQEHVLLLVVHHVAFDGWSVGVLADELGPLYAAALAGEDSPLPPPRLQYGDAAAWQRRRMSGETLERQLSYWRDRLAGLEPLELPTDRPRPPVRDARGGSVPLHVPAELAAPLLALGREHGATPFMTLLAPFALLLSRYGGRSDVAVGTPIAGRTRPELEPLIGCFVNTLVLRLGVDPDASFPELLEQTKETALAAYAHQELPFERLAHELELPRDLSRNPLFQVLFALQNTGAAELRLPGLEAEELPVDQRTAKFDLTLVLEQRPDGELAGELEYATALFDEATVERIRDHYLHLLESIRADPHAPLHRLGQLPPAERQTILHDWNDTRAPLPELLLHEAFEQRARSRPDATAVVFEDGETSYAQLDARTTKLARHLRRIGVGPESVVAVCLERSADLVIALLAVLRAGGAYLPLDPDHPRDRLAFVLEDAQPHAVLTSERLLPLLPERKPPAVLLDRDRARIEAEPAEPLEAGVDGSNAAYVIYTSGSTGRPKGVVVEHGAIANRIEWMQRAYRLTPEDRVLQKTPYSFDVSVWEFFWPLTTGAQLVVASPGGHRDDDYLSRLIQERGVTVCHFVPSMLRAFLEQPELEERCHSLRLVVCSGEVLGLREQRRFLERLPAELHNLYGPTEAAVDVSSWPCRPDETLRTVPIGRPIDNLALYVLDDRLEPVPVGVPGEVYIGGVGLARGYLRRPHLTAERFVPNPLSETPGQRLYRTGDLGRYLSNGAIEYLGRSDLQVKIRGFRIELGEIEAALADHPAVAAAVVDARAGADGDERLVAYVVPEDAPPAPEELRAFLAQRLPEHMVPPAYVVIDALPLTSSGKADRKALADPEAGRPQLDHEHVLPRTPEEELVAGVWSGVLGVDAVGVTDPFFDLGGDSIRAVAVVGALRARGFDVSVQDLFLHATVAELAGLVGGRPPVTERTPVEPFELLAPEDVEKLPPHLADAYPLSQIQAGMVYELLADSSRGNYHNVTSYWVRDDAFSLEALRAAARIVGSRHEILRTAFDLTRFSEPLQLVYPSVEVDVEVEDVRGLDEDAQKARLHEFIATERARPFDLERPPLYRLFVHVTRDDAWRLSLCECHAILDGWSHNSFVTELLHVYRACRAGEEPEPHDPPQVRFADFVALERAALDSEEDERFWRERVETFPALRLPDAWRTPGAGATSHERLVPFSDLETALRQVARSAQVPFKSVLHAAHLSVLAETTGKRRFFAGLVSHGRPERAGGDRIRGLFLNTVPFPVDLDEAPTWRELAQAVFAEEIAAWPHRRFPLPEMQRRWGRGAPLVEAIFTYLDFHVLDRSIVDAEQTVDASPNEFPLQVTLDPGALVLTAHRDRIDPIRLARLAERYRSALERLAADPDAALADGFAPPETEDERPAGSVRDAAPEPAPAPSAPYEAPRTPLEATIADVWRELLGVERIGVHDDFHDLGGYSLLLLKVATRLRERGIDVSPRHVLERRTVAALASVLEQARVTSTGGVRPESFQALVWLKEEGARPPLFCVHPGGGSTHWYAPLAERLGCAVAAFEAPGLAGEREPFAKVEEAAAFYLDELRRVQPEGPYRLFGWCGGSGVTMEMASRLRAAGEELALVLLDPAIGGAETRDLPEQEELFGRAERLYARLRVGLPADEAEATRRKIVDLLLEAGVIDLVEDEVEELGTRVHVWRVMARSLIEYSFRPYDGSLRLVIGDQVAAGEHSVVSGITPDDYLDRWRRVTRGALHVDRIAGDHFTVLQPPSVDRLAEILAETTTLDRDRNRKELVYR